jgi:anti-sigma regulatory factor (Ser/Thr protein kinase)
MSGLHGASRPAVLRLSLACNLAGVRPAAEAARVFLAEQGCAGQDLVDYELALVEACNNAIRHCTASGRHKPVLVEVLCDKKEIELRVTDHTPGFEWPEKVALPDSESESGRGLYLIQTLMHYTNYLRGQGVNVLVMRKKK